MLRSRGLKKIHHTQAWFSNFENFRLSPWNERGKKAWLTEGVCVGDGPPDSNHSPQKSYSSLGRAPQIINAPSKLRKGVESKFE